MINEGVQLEDLMTVQELMAELVTMPPDAHVMIPVVKYPGEFKLEETEDGELRWDLHSDVEVVPVESGDIIFKDGQCWITVELTEYNAERAQLNGARTDGE